MSQINPSSSWDAANYTSTGAFVSELGAGVFDLLAPKPGERILDVGCGDGALTLRIQEAGASTLGVDASEELLEVAKSRGVSAQLGDAAALEFDEEFDAVFSNAVLHWVTDAQAAANSMFRALKPGGRLVVEFGGFGNIAAIRAALAAVLAKRGFEDIPDDHYFPTPAQYAAVLENLGFEDVNASIIHRPTLVADGIYAWLETFRTGLLDRLGLSKAEQQDVFEQVTEILRPILFDPDSGWWADYVRIRVSATKPQ